MNETVNAFLAIRLGSTRVPFKNLRLLDQKPLYEYLTDSAIECKNIDNLYINSDSNIVIDISKTKYGNLLNYYQRPEELGTSEASLDDYVYDFMTKFESDYTVFLNPCSLFLKAKTIDNAIKYAIDKNLDSCVASFPSRTHCFLDSQAINFDSNERQPRSQDIIPVHNMTSGFFIWKNVTFKSSYDDKGFANFSGKFESYAITKIEAVDIDEEEDFEFAERLITGKYNSDAKFHDNVSHLITQGKIKTN